MRSALKRFVQVLLDATNLNTNGIMLTQVPTVDYNSVKATPATLSGLASVILPQNPRELEGVFEVHSVAVLGVSSGVNADAFQMPVRISMGSSSAGYFPLIWRIRKAAVVSPCCIMTPQQGFPFWKATVLTTQPVFSVRRRGVFVS